MTGIVSCIYQLYSSVILVHKVFLRCYEQNPSGSQSGLKCHVEHLCWKVSLDVSFSSFKLGQREVGAQLCEERSMEESAKRCQTLGSHMCESSDFRFVALGDCLVVCGTFHPKQGGLQHEGQIPPHVHTLVLNGRSCCTFTFLKPHFLSVCSVMSPCAQAVHGSAVT